MKKIKQKRGEVVVGESMGWILFFVSLLLVASGVIFFYKDNILLWAKNIPDYNSQGNGEIDISEMSEDELNLLGCDNFVGRIYNEKVYRCIDNCKEAIYSYIFLKDNELYVKDPRLLSGDLLVGEINDGEIVLYNSVFMSEDYLDLVGYLEEVPSEFFLRSLDGSNELGVGNILCNKRVVVSLNEGDVLGKIPEKWIKTNEGVYRDDSYYSSEYPIRIYLSNKEGKLYVDKILDYKGNSIISIWVSENEIYEETKIGEFKIE